MYLKLSFLALAVALSAYAATLPERSLVTRAVCPELCDPVTNADAQCKAESNYDKCFCKVEILMGIDNCFACLVMNLEANDALNSVLTGGGVIGNSADSIRAAGQRTHNQMIAGCQAAGYALDGSGSTGSTTGSGNGGASAGTSGGNSGAGASTSATGNTNSNGGTMPVKLSGVSLLVLLAAGIGSLF